MRIIWFISGLCCIALGGLGVILPLLPTVPFVLLAAICFARSSDTAYKWLLHHRVFGPSIRDWQRNGAIRPSVKRKAVLAIAASWLFMLYLDLGFIITLVQFIALFCVVIFIVSRPNA